MEPFFKASFIFTDLWVCNWNELVSDELMYSHIFWCNKFFSFPRLCCVFIVRKWYLTTRISPNKYYIFKKMKSRLQKRNILENVKDSVTLYNFLYRPPFLLSLRRSIWIFNLKVFGMRSHIADEFAKFTNSLFLRHFVA